MWVAYLNMENLYGSEEATLALLSRALAHTDARRMYLAAVDIFERAGKGHLVEQCLKAMTRKFNASPDVSRVLHGGVCCGEKQGRVSWGRSAGGTPSTMAPYPAERTAACCPHAARRSGCER